MSKSLVLASLVLLAATAYAAEPAEKDAPVQRNTPALKDPTQPYRPNADGSPVGAPQPRFRLTGLLISPTRRIAIMNGKPLQEGQHVAGAQIVKIDAHSVQLRDGDRDLVIQLGNARPNAAAAEGDTGK